MQWDVIVVGGGSAGLSAALMLGRARRRVLVIDSGEPRNGMAEHMHGVLGHDDLPPRDLLAKGRGEVARYGVEVRDGTATAATVEADGVTVTAGTVERARRLVLATGLRDRLPDIPGLEALWGSRVLVCPYCDGWEARDARIGVIATGAGGIQQAQLLRQWSEDVTYLGGELTDPDPVDAAGLAARAISLERRGISRVSPQADGLDVHLSDGDALHLDAVFLHPRPEPRAELLQLLGAALDERGWPVVDSSGRTSVTNVWAVGNLSSVVANVPVAMASGSMAGGAINADLVAEEIALAIR
jgi:thioredoxin reductase